ncbi:hypothetical protein AB0E52_11495 [Micrococcus luteus]|uniref:hypothetical protein n=1 Tax=Micrococcus luteus TaxID=1270 RepID=UPI00340AD7D2
MDKGTDDAFLKARIERTRDPFDGRTMAVISFDNTSIWRADDYTPALVDRVLAYDRSATVRVRVTDDKVPVGKWLPYLTYLSLPMSTQKWIRRSDVTIEGALFNKTHPYRQYIRGWLLQALKAGYGTEYNEELAVSWINAAEHQGDWISFVALRGRTPVGHITLQPDTQRFINSRTRYSEVIDSLVETRPGERKGDVESDLVAAASDWARHRGQDLLGNVVHNKDQDGHGWKIVETLLRKGWKQVETVWTRAEHIDA